MAYCNLAHTAKYLWEVADECMVVCAGELLCHVAEAMRKEIKALLSSSPVGAVAEDNTHSATAASICSRLAALMTAAAERAKP